MKKSIVLLLLVSLCGLVMADTFQTHDIVYSSDITDATWVQLDKQYDARNGGEDTPDDAFGQYRVVYDPTTCKLKFEAQIYDTNNSFTDDYAAWNGQDCLEIYVRHPEAGTDQFFSGFNAAGAQKDAQQYRIGIKDSDNSSAWSVLQDNSSWALPTGTSLGGSFDGTYQNFYGEIALYKQYGEVADPQLANIPGCCLEPCDFVGFDMAYVTVDFDHPNADDATWGPYKGMIANNTVGGKFYITDAIAMHHITPEPMTLALLGLGGLMIRRKK